MLEGDINKRFSIDQALEELNLVNIYALIKLLPFNVCFNNLAFKLFLFILYFFEEKI